MRRPARRIFVGGDVEAPQQRLKTVSANRAPGSDLTAALIICGHRPDKSVLFVTNNATQSRKMYVKKFERLGVEAYVVRAFPPPETGVNLPGHGEHTSRAPAV